MGSQKPLSYSTPNMRRSERYLKESESLKQNGYDVHTSKKYPNNAYYAIEKGADHYPHELDVVKILAENGFPAMLKKEGTVMFDGNQMPSVDGISSIGKLTFEIRQTQESVEKKLVTKVADAISHSKKTSKSVNSYVVQADVAVSYTKNRKVHESVVKDGIISHNSREESKRGNPKFLLQVDGNNRKVYLYKIK